MTKNRGKKTREKNFQKTRIGYQKNVGKKLSQKSAQKFFFNKHMNIVTTNGGKKCEKKILPETHVYLEQKTMEKNRLEKVRKHVSLTHEYRDEKSGEKTREKNFQKTHE